MLVAVAIFAFFGHAFLNYDSFYALVWGKDLVHGITPDYQVPVAPTPHPLAILVGALLSPLSLPNCISIVVRPIIFAAFPRHSCGPSPYCM